MSDAPARFPRRNLIIASCALGALAAAGFGLYWERSGRFLIGTDNAYAEADIVIMAPRITGYVAGVAVADNQRVAAGAVLARIEDRDYRARRDQAAGAVAAAEADLQAQQARIANLDAAMTQQRSMIAGSAAQVAAGEADAHRAYLAFRRQSSLFADEVTSAQDRETAEADARKTAASADSARAGLAAQRDQLPVLVAERDEAVAGVVRLRAVLQQARAALVLAQYDLDCTVLRAPVAGIVGQRVARVGGYAEAGTPLLAVVPDAVYVVANYKETQIDKVRAGQAATVTVDALDGAKLLAHVDSFAPASGAQFALLPPDNATGNFTKIVQRMPVRLRIDPGQARARELRPGMSVVATIDTRHE